MRAAGQASHEWIARLGVESKILLLLFPQVAAAGGEGDHN